MPDRCETVQIALCFDPSLTEQRQILSGVVQFLRQHQMEQKQSLSWRLQSPTHDVRYAASCDNWQPQGIITYSPTTQLAQSLLPRHIPTVAVALSRPDTQAIQTITVCPDNAAIGRLGAEHLLACNLQSFAFYGYHKHSKTYWSVARELSFWNTIRQSSSSFHTLRVSKQRDHSNKLVTWLLSLPKPIGIMAADDLLAHDITNACDSLHLSVPDQIAVLGVGNDNILCEYNEPGISSVNLSMSILGHEAAVTLDALLKHDALEIKTPSVPSDIISVKPAGITSRTSTNVYESSDPVLVALIQKIHSHQFEKVDIAQLAKHHGLSRWQVENRFRSAFGRSTHDEICRHRVSILQKLLLTTDIPLRNIAKQTGFPSVQYMTTFIKRHTGVTPAKLRNIQTERAMKIRSHE